MEENLKKQVEEKLKDITQEGLNLQDLQVVSELVDVHKDLCNEDYWKAKKEAMKMRYNRGYDEYNEYGRDSYGRRGVPGTGRRYRGEETMDDMYDAYRNYSDGRSEMNRGNYSAKADTMRSLEYMMQSVVQFIEMLKRDANSQEEVELIQDYTRQISEM